MLLGLLKLSSGGISLGLGTAGSILVFGLVTGWARSRYPVFGAIPEPAQRLLMDIGLTAFIGVVGLQAGPHAVEAFRPPVLATAPEVVLRVVAQRRHETVDVGAGLRLRVIDHGLEHLAMPRVGGALELLLALQRPNFATGPHPDVRLGLDLIDQVA